MKTLTIFLEERWHKGAKMGFYDKDDIISLAEDDEISSSELGFMQGYLEELKI